MRTFALNIPEDQVANLESIIQVAIEDLDDDAEERVLGEQILGEITVFQLGR
jgi:hypothetical protein